MKDLHMKQKVLRAGSAAETQSVINTALDMGWLVQSITVNSGMNQWIIVLYRND